MIMTSHASETGVYCGMRKNTKSIHGQRSSTESVGSVQAAKRSESIQGLLRVRDLLDLEVVTSQTRMVGHAL